MSEFSELIKNFDKTRDYLRDFFIYGFKLRNDYTKKSARTYDNEKRRIESWLRKYFRSSADQKGKRNSIFVNSGNILQNPLYKAYYSKSFTDNDIKLHFFITDLLKSNPDGLNIREITELLSLEYDEIFEEQTVRNKLKEYVGEGLYTSQKKGKTDYYFLSSPSCKSLLKKYEGLCDAVMFHSNSSVFGVIGSYILRAAGKKNKYFIQKHNYIVHTLEDEILLDISGLISEKHAARITTFSYNNLPVTHNAVFLQIRISSQTGRRYVSAFDPSRKIYKTYRLDYIRKIEDNGPFEEFDSVYESFLSNEKYIYGVSISPATDRDNIYHIKMVIAADETTESFIFKRAEREKRNGTVSKTGKDLITYSGDFYDPGEMMTWVKTFTGRIVEFSCEQPQTEERLKNDISELYKMYHKSGGNDE